MGEINKGNKKLLKISYVQRLLLISTLFIINNLNCHNTAVIAQEIFIAPNRVLESLDDDNDDLDNENNEILEGAADDEMNNKPKGHAQGEPAPAKSQNEPKSKDEDWQTQDLIERYNRGEIKILLESIFPRGGPTYGTTRVTLRAQGLAQFVDVFPNPICKFGLNTKTVDATYVKCTKKPLGFYDREIDSRNMNETCIECDASPPVDEPEILDIQVSLTGKFDDVYTSLPYRYYKPLKIEGIYPRYGLKDGNSVVQVWGQNFLDLGDDFRCNFGTTSTKAYYINDNYIWCRSAFSDVVGRPMPFSVSLNRQQNSLQPIDFWYYNTPQISKIIPDYGPMQGGTKILIKGSGFLPFDWKLDIDNRNDTFCNFGTLGRSPAFVISSTEAECTTPPNNQHLEYAPVNLTLNNQNYTQADIRFIYYNPPKILDAEPLTGPVQGDTLINLWGSQFEKNRNITCFFGQIQVQAKYVSKQHLTCMSPEVKEPGDVKLIVKYENDRFESDLLSFKYFANPVLNEDPLSPSCGPVEGFTQITVRGRNFVEFHFGQAKCIYNETIYMNATVLNPETIVCDSPILDSANSEMFYKVAVTLDGTFKTNSTGIFRYYREPIISSISPVRGPTSGGTVSIIKGKGFAQKGICLPTARYGRNHVAPKDLNDTQFTAVSPSVHILGDEVVSFSGNGQQFIDDKTLHFRDVENNFQYYEDFFIKSVVPTDISNAGNSPLILSGMQFDQFKYDNETKEDVTLQCRFKEEATGAYIDVPRNMTRMTDSKMRCIAPNTTAVGPFRIEISANGQDWQDINHQVRYFNGPRVTGVNPTYGVTKNPKNQNLEIYGDNFVCPNNDCSKIKARFTNAQGDKIYMDAKMSETNTVIVPIPKYPAPETLDVDVSFNGQDFTNDAVKFGFLDPFILGIKPRLISTHGTTKLNITGYGFVSMEESKQLVVMKRNDETLQCSEAICTKVYHVTNENSALIDTFDQPTVNTQDKNIEFDPFTVNMMNPDGDFTKNDIMIWYYKDPNFASLSSYFAYANEDKPLMITTDFFWGQGNDFQTFRKYSNFTCRFTSENDATKSIITYAIMETSPIGQYNKSLLPDQIRCRTPRWNSVDTALLEISVNGQDYIGSYKVSFVDKLQIFKISPLSGPIGGETKVKLFGTGFQSSIPQNKPLFIRFGTIESQIVDKGEISDFSWSSEEYHSEFHTSESILHDAEVNDFVIPEGQSVKKYIAAVTPDVSRSYGYTSPDVKGLGGPVYIRIGESVDINITGHDKSGAVFGQATTGSIDLVYSDSSDLEFYFYRQPVVQKIEPTSGLTSGGTDLELTGAWFDFQPKYGVIPFCQIGTHIIRARYITTNRIICKTPESSDTFAPSPVAVSLNGVDFQDTGFTFSYYEKPVIVDLQPRSGSIEGGTEIWLKGLKFSNITHGLRTVKCRFTQIPTIMADGNSTFDVDNAPVKYIPAYFVDNDTMKCASPSGWVGGDQVKVDLTFNGVDYTDASFVFSFYNIFGSFPKSGPSTAYDQFIQVKGQGFRPESTVLCVLNKIEYAPLQVRSGVIKCPMVKDTWPADAYESVPFNIRIDGSVHEFGNFHYYKNPTLDDVSPLMGPQEGRGAIYFIGRDFRDDFENSKLGCRIGNVLGVAQLIDSETVRCQISKKIPLVDEGQSLSVSLALNSYSWIQSDFSFTPYGIIDFYPNSGPIGENTNILVVGKGFDNEMKEFARCKFGTDDNYVIVEAQVLDNEHMICKSPSEEITLPDDADSVISLPFSIAFQEDIYYPYTEGPQKYRLYKHPTIIDIMPQEAQIGKLTEVYIIADEDDSFWQPIPTVGGLEDDNYGIKCKFGRFGSSAATYVNRTHILCLTPNIQDDPADISEESVKVTVAMNGVDFNDDYSEVEFIFIGTGGSISILVVILGTLIFGLLIVSVLIFVGGLQEFIKQKSREEIPRPSYTHINERGNIGPAHQSRASNRSRSNQGNFGNRPRSRASDFAMPGSRQNQNEYGYGNNGGAPGGGLN